MELYFLWISILLSFGCVALLFKFPKVMYYFGFAALYIQTGLLVFKYQAFHDILVNFSGKYKLVYQSNPGLILTALFALIPFFIPLLFSYFTSVFVSNVGIGIVSFFFFSIVQVTIIGQITGGANFIKGILKIVLDAIPILSFLMTVINVYPSGELTIMNMAPSDFLIISGICCCQGILFIGFLIALYLYYSKSKKISSSKNKTGKYSAKK